MLCAKFVQDHPQAAVSPAISLNCAHYLAIEGFSNFVWALLDVPTKVKSNMAFCKLCKLAGQSRQIVLLLRVCVHCACAFHYVVG